MEQGPSQLCPRCGTPRVGSFRWCRSCQFDFDAGRVAGGSVAPPAPPPTSDPPPAAAPIDHAFTLPTTEATLTAAPAPVAAVPVVQPSASQPAPSAAAPSAVAAAAPAAAPARPSAAPRIPRRARLPLTVAAIVAVVLAISLILIPPPSSAPVVVASASASAAASAGPTRTVAPNQAVAPTPFARIDLSGTGSQDVRFSIPDGSPGLATIVNDGQGAFSVWTVGADGTRDEQLVSAVGPFAGTRLFDENGHSTAFSVESDGSWLIEVNPISSARTWDLTERLTGDGSDVVLVVPPTSSLTNTVVRHDGESNFVVSALTTGGKVQLLNDIGRLDEQLVLPAGTSLIEVQAEAAWSIAPQ